MYNPEYQRRTEIDRSLFPSDEKVISNEAIAKILEGKINLPAKCNIAVQQMGLDWGYEPGYQAEKMEILKSELTKSSRTGSVMAIPDMLMRLDSPSQQMPSISNFREAAARLQCELVLFYRIDQNYRHRDRVLGKDTAMVYMTVQGLVLHTRTGLFPFTTWIDQEYQQVENKDNAGPLAPSFTAQVKNEAMNAALHKLGQEVAGFLDKVSVQQSAQAETPQTVSSATTTQ
jgi:hypothetical protein